jgi:diguanylate cyclase (GGDEF)-like protein/PAS domain S-box-containing protein
MESLLELGLLDTDPEVEFDELVQLASAICETPISLMTLVDSRRQWFKAALGLDVRETPREVAFCAHAIERPELFVVEDAVEDRRFAKNPLVTGNPGIRFYAGMPLATPNGSRVGTLCVIDTVPRRLTEVQKSALAVLGKQMMARMEMRLQHRELGRVLSEKERFATELQASEQMFRTFMDNSPFVSYMKSSEGRFTYYSRRFSEIFVTPGEDWLGTVDEDHFSPEQAAQFKANDAAILRSGVGAVVEESTSNPDGSEVWWRSHKFPCQGAGGELLLGGISVDVTKEWRHEVELRASKLELEELNAQLKRLSLTDALTGLKNRRAFDDRMHLELSLVKRRSRPVTVVLMDIDFFKRVNDEYGHAAGDQVLCQVALVLQASVRTTDMPARYGGEEFAVILPETSAEQAQEWARRFASMLTRVSWEFAPVTVSLGIAEWVEAWTSRERCSRWPTRRSTGPSARDGIGRSSITAKERLSRLGDDEKGRYRCR